MPCLSESNHSSCFKKDFLACFYKICVFFFIHSNLWYYFPFKTLQSRVWHAVPFDYLSFLSIISLIEECFLFRSLLYLFSSQVHSKARLPFTWTSSLEWNKIAFESIHYANELQHDFSWNLFLEKFLDWIRIVANACQIFCEISLVLKSKIANANLVCCHLVEVCQ